MEAKEPARMDERDYEEVDLREILAAIGSKWRLVLAVTLLCFLGAVLGSLIMPKVYKAEALVDLGNIENHPLKAAEAKEILESPSLLARALKEMGLPDDSRALKAYRIQAQPVKDSNYIKFSLETSKKKEIQPLGEKVISLFVEERNRDYQEQKLFLEENLKHIEENLARTEVGTERLSEAISSLERAPLGELDKKILTLQVLQIQGAQAQEKLGLLNLRLTYRNKLMALKPAKVVSGIGEPLKLRPRLALNAALGLILGAMVGVFLALASHWWQKGEGDGYG